jgi:uncharacterized repeat protein (TIGR01451 family)
MRCRPASRAVAAVFTVGWLLLTVAVPGESTGWATPVPAVLLVTDGGREGPATTDVQVDDDSDGSSDGEARPAGTGRDPESDDRSASDDEPSDRAWRDSTVGPSEPDAAVSPVTADGEASDAGGERWRDATVDPVARDHPTAGADSGPDATAGDTDAETPRSDDVAGPPSVTEQSDAAGSASEPLPGVPGVRETDRWTAAVTAGLAVGAAGVLLGNAAVLLAAAVPFAYAAYGSSTRTPPLSVTVDRSVDDTTPRPGDPVTVTTTVANDGDEPIPDLRVVDGVPDDLPVVEGSPRAVASLSAGESATLTYRVVARRGDHAFGPAALFARGVSGAVERHATRSPSTRIRCHGGVDAVPMRGVTGQSPGRIPTDAGGEGLAFHAVRAYQPSDPMSRIDWNRFARTGELTTIEFQQERAATVVLVVDDRPAVDQARSSHDPTAAEYAAYAAEHVAGPLLRANDAVGVARLGDGTYLPPTTGRAQQLRVARLLDGDEPSGTRSLGIRTDGSSIRSHLPSTAQVVFLTPLLDDTAVTTAERFEAHGHPVTVLSPDVTGDSPGGRLARLDRERRIRSLRESRVRLVDWPPDEPLQAAVERASRGWSA